MSKKRLQPPIKSLTEVELEMMNIIWQIGPCTVNEIIAALPPERELAYTSVSTIVRILEQKNYVSSTKEGRGHRYTADVAKEAYQTASIHHLIDKVFDATPATLVRRLLASETLDKDAIATLREMLDEKDQ